MSVFVTVISMNIENLRETKHSSSFKLNTCWCKSGLHCIRIYVTTYQICMFKSLISKLREPYHAMPIHDLIYNSVHGYRNSIPPIQSNHRHCSNSFTPVDMRNTVQAVYWLGNVANFLNRDVPLK